MHCPTLTKPNVLALGVATLTLFSFGLFTTHSVFAQISDEEPTTISQTTLTAIPPKLGEDNTIMGAPGEVLQRTIQVKNTSNTSLNIISKAYDYTIDEDGETPIPVTDQDVSNRWSLASWVTVAPNLQTIQPNETKSIAVVIEIPEDALPGGHYAMILHQPTTQAVGNPDEIVQESISASGISQRVGTLLYVKVEGDINESAFIRSFSFPNITEYGPVPFSFSIENQSDIHITPSLMMEIRDMFGRKVDQLPIEAENVFPLTERAFEGKWNKVWGTGRYTATLTMSYGTQGAVAIAKTSFWLFPVVLVVATILVLLVLLAVIISVRRHLIHRSTDQSSVIKELEKKIVELEKQPKE